MNAVMISGTVADDSELRTIESGRELVNFNLQVDGFDGKDPIIRIGFFPKAGDPKKIPAGLRLAVLGAIRYRNDARGLFVAASEIFVSLAEAVPVTSAGKAANADRTWPPPDVKLLPVAKGENEHGNQPARPVRN